jgi:hypothetical protein
MRLPRVSPVLLLATLIACSASQSPTSPSDRGDIITPPPEARATAVTTSVNFPIEISVFIPCANGGAGEDVLLSGELHDLFQVTLTSNGHFTLKFLDNPQGITGLGSVTGNKYQGTGGTQQTVTGTIGTELTFVNNFRIIGQGPGNNFLVQEVAHVTVNANGTVTVNFDNFSADCR